MLFSVQVVYFLLLHFTSFYRFITIFFILLKNIWVASILVLLPIQLLRVFLYRSFHGNMHLFLLDLHFEIMEVLGHWV